MGDGVWPELPLGDIGVGWLVPGLAVVGLTMAPGEAVGEAVGYPARELVGKTVGDTVGYLVGKTIGDTVGYLVGKTVGDTVGYLVGKTVGDTVGYLVGDAAGEAVGSGFMGDGVGLPVLPGSGQG
jgi:membrane protein DedA with SNARE-associated domain